MIEIYFILILFCLGASLLNMVSRQNFLWIYFLLVAAYELGLFYGWVSPEVYNSSPLAYITFFVFYYARQKNSCRKTLCFLGITVLAGCLWLFYRNGMAHYSVKAGITVSVVYILFALQWFLSQLTHVDATSLLRKQAFWISVSLLIWSVFFLFRLIPMYWLDIHDTVFLNQIHKAFQILTILCYGLFFRALLCKF
jgi:hypothetical protein